MLPPLQSANAAADFYESSMQATMRHQIYFCKFILLVEIKLYEDASNKNAYRHAMKVIHLYIQGNLTLEVL